MVWPAAEKFAVEVDFAIERFGSCVAGTVMVLDDTGVSGGPVGGVAVTVAVLTTVPESRSA